MLSLPEMLNKIHQLGKEYDEDVLTGLHKVFGRANYRLIMATKPVKPLSDNLDKLLMKGLTNLAVDLEESKISPLPDDVQVALNHYKEHGVR